MDIILNITLIIGIGVIFIGPIVLLFLKLRGVSQKKADANKAKQIFTELREMAFSAASRNASTNQSQNKILVVLVEIGLEGGAVSLRCFADGTISVLFSSGGGTIGLGGRENVEKAGLKLLEESEKYITYFKLVKDHPLPTLGQTIFYLVTISGIYMYESSGIDLGNNQSELSPLFCKAQDVITQWRIIEENNKGRLEA